MNDEFAMIPIEFQSEQSDLPKIRKALTGTLSKDDTLGLLKYRCHIALEVGTSNPDIAIHAP